MRPVRPIGPACVAALVLFGPAVSAEAQILPDWSTLVRGARAVAQRTEIREGRRYLHADFSADELDLVVWKQRLERLGIPIPLELEGKLTAQLRLSVPVGSPGTGRFYRLDGWARSERMVVDGVELRELTAQVLYEDGVLRLERLRFRTPDDAGKTAGRVTGKATLGVVPRGNLLANLSLEGVPIVPLLEAFEGWDDIRDGRLSGAMQVEVPADRFADLTAWTASGQAGIENLRDETHTLDAASARFTVHRGVLRVSEFTAQSGGVTLAGIARGDIVEPYRYRASLKSIAGTFEALAELAPEVELPFPLGGRFELRAFAEGTLQPFTAETAGQGVLTGVTAEGFTVDRAEFRYAMDDERLKISELVASAYGGRLTGEGSVPLNGAGELEARLRWGEVDAGLIAAELFADTRPLAGSISGTVTARVAVAGVHDPSAWKAAGEIALVDVAAYGWSARQATSRFTLTAGRLTLPDLSADLEEGILRGEAGIEVSAPYPYTTGLRISGMRLDAFNRMPEELRLPVAVDGRASLTVNAEGSLQPFHVAATGTVSAVEMHVDELLVDRAEFAFATDGRQLRLENMSAALYGGGLTGSAVLPVNEGAAGALDVRWERLDLGEMAGAVVATAIILDNRFRGFHGHIRAEIPAGKLQDRTAWTASGAFELDEFQFYGWAGLRMTAELRLGEGLLSLRRLGARLHEREIAGSASVHIIAPHGYAADLDLWNFDLSPLPTLPLTEELSLPAHAAGRLDFSAALEGTLEPLTVTGEGAGSLEDVEIAEVKLDRLAFDFALGESQLRLQNLVADLYDGQMTGSAIVPLRDEAAGEASVRWKKVDLAALAVDWAEIPFALKGKSAGSLDVQIPAGAFEDWRVWTVAGTVDAPRIRSGRIPVGNVDGTFGLEERVLSYNFGGDVLGGRFTLEGSFPVTGKGGGVAGRMLVTGVKLRRVSQLLSREPVPLVSVPLAGLADLRLDFETREDNVLPVGRGAVSLSRVRWDNKLLTRRLQGPVVWTGDELRLEQLTGEFASGRLLVQANYHTATPDRSAFNVSLQGANASQALLVWPELNELVDGTLDVQMRGNLGRVWQVSGRAGLARGGFAGTELGSWRIPFHGSVDPATGRARFQFRDTSAQLARGRVTGTLDASWAGGLTLDGDFRLSRVELQSLLRQTADLGQLGNGRVSGRVTLSGSNVRSLGDLAARIQLEFENTQMAAVPIIRELRPYLTPSVSGGSAFDTGTLRARLTNGILRIQEFTLSGSSVQLFADGAITVDNQRLDLNVIANTGQSGQDRSLVEYAVRRLPAAGPVPVALLMQLNDALANRVIYLKVTGTVRRPTAAVRPLPQLQEEAIRYFVQQPRAAGSRKGTGLFMP